MLSAPTTKDTSSSLVNCSKDVIQQRQPPSPPPRLQKPSYSGNKFKIGRTANSKSKYNQSRGGSGSAAHPKYNGIRDSIEPIGDNDDIVLAPQTQSNTSSNSMKTSTPTSSNSKTTTTRQLCHICLRTSDLSSELKCC